MDLSQHVLDKVLGGQPVRVTDSLQCQHRRCSTAITFIQKLRVEGKLEGETVAGKPVKRGEIMETQTGRSGIQLPNLLAATIIYR